MTLPLQPMSTAPRDGRKVLACFHDDEFITVTPFSDGRWSDYDSWLHKDDDFSGWLDIDEMARDKERLDWLGKTYPHDGLFGPTTEARDLTHGSRGWSCGNNVLGGWHCRETFREAIDAARAAIDKEMANG